VDSECPTSQICASTGVCIEGERKDGTLFPDTDVTGQDIVPVTCPAPELGELMLNEILADPGNSLDANGDGIADSTDDEFVEIVNWGSRELNLGGLELKVKGETKHTFAPQCVAAGQAILVFSGGTVEPRPQFEGAAALKSAKKLSLVNGGATIDLYQGSFLLDTMTYGTEGGKDQSLTRYPDLHGPWTLHGDVEGGALMSPGTCALGGPFPNCPTTIGPPTDADVSTQPDTGDSVTTTDPGVVCPNVTAELLVLNEVLADPPVGNDVNKDGNASSTQDEFLEIVLLGSEGVNMQGVDVVVNGAIKYSFNDSCLHPGAILLFSGGSPAADQFPGVEVRKSTKALGLVQAGAEIRITGPSGDLDTHSYGQDGNNDQSLTRSPDLTGDFVLHSEAEGAFAMPMSPGTCVNGGALPECVGSCVPDCTQEDGNPKECGEDGCGGFCGPDCADGQACVDGVCSCAPDCNFTDGSPKECGDDGCGGTCGPITAEGCCDTIQNVHYCSGGFVMTLDCPAEENPEFQKCGWVEGFGFYDCTSESVAEPTGTYPIDCGF